MATIEEIREQVLAAIRLGPTTLGRLTKTLDGKVGYREIDRTLQWLRREGLIENRREGRDSLWSEKAVQVNRRAVAAARDAVVEAALDELAASEHAREIRDFIHGDLCGFDRHTMHMAECAAFSCSVLFSHRRQQAVSRLASLSRGGAENQP